MKNYTLNELIEFGEKKQWKSYEGKSLSFSEIPENHLINICDHVRKLHTKFSKEFADQLLSYAVKIRKIPFSKIEQGQIPHIDNEGNLAVLEIDEEHQTAQKKILKSNK